MKAFIQTSLPAGGASPSRHWVVTRAQTTSSPVYVTFQNLCKYQGVFCWCRLWPGHHFMQSDIWTRTSPWRADVHRGRCKRQLTWFLRNWQPNQPTDDTSGNITSLPEKMLSCCIDKCLLFGWKRSLLYTLVESHCFEHNDNKTFKSCFV